VAFSSLAGVANVLLYYAVIWHGRFGSDNKNTLVGMQQNVFFVARKEAK
jgi:hypothetical protein